MAHEGLVITLLILGILLIISFYMGPYRYENRRIKQFEAKIILIPTGVILIVMAAVLFSGVLG